MFYKIDQLILGPFETCLWSRHISFLKKIKQGICACVVSNFHPGLEKMSITWKIWDFHSGLRFHLGLAKPSWNFNSVYPAEFSHVTAMSFWRGVYYLDEIKFQLSIPSWNLNAGWKSPYKPLKFVRYRYP